MTTRETSDARTRDNKVWAVNGFSMQVAPVGQRFFDRRVGITRHEDHAQVRPAGRQVACELTTVHPRQHHIRQQEVERAVVGGELRQRLLARSASSTW